MTLVTKRSGDTFITPINGLDMVNQGNGTYNLTVLMDDKINCGVQVKNIAGANGLNTYKIWARCDDFGGVPFIDVTQYFTENASYTGDFLKAFVAPVKELRVEVVRTGDLGEADGAFRIMISRA
jgi:hypothetical protein